MIEIVEMGASLADMQYGAVMAVTHADTVVLQTSRPAAAAELCRLAKACMSLDPLFEEAADFESLYENGADEILACPGNTVFCCLGDPAENGFVRALNARTQTVFAGGGDPVRRALSLSGESASSYAVYEARGLADVHFDTTRTVVIRSIDDIYQAQQVKLRLTEFYPADLEITVVDESGAQKIRLGEMDRRSSWGSGALAVIRPLAFGEQERFTYYDLVSVMQRLRAPGGCPWDMEQTHQSLVPYLIEEAHEVAEAVDGGDLQQLADELGDALLQVIFHAEIARSQGEFDEMDVTDHVTAKMIRRHPHVFGDVKAADAKTVLENWDAIKRREKGEKSVADTMEDIPKSVGALMRADKIQKKAANIGFDWPDWQGAFEKTEEECREFLQAVQSEGKSRQLEEGGDLLFAAVNLLRLAGLDPETALQAACRKFIRRFRYMERNAPQPLSGMSAAQMDTLWEEAKETEKD